jgi:hypothetical protein
MLLAAAVCCNSCNPPPPTPTTPGGTGQTGSDGTLSHVRDDIEYGSGSGSLQSLSAGDRVTFGSGDRVHVFNGGEGRLDFGSDMVLRLFNDTNLNVVRILADAGSPREVQMRLEDGGFTGTYSASGGSMTVDTPGGTAVLVRGTEFFVVYAPGSQVTLAGNFGGTVELDWGSGPTPLSSGYFREILPGGPTGPEQPIPLTRAEFEDEVNQTGSMLRVTELIMEGAYEEPGPIVETTPPVQGETPVTCFIGFNLDSYPYYNEQVRRALSWAIDREALVEMFNPGLWQAAYSMVPPGVWPDGGYYATGINYDPDYAQQLMFEADFAGVDLSLTFFEPYADRAEFIANAWQEAFDSSVELDAVPDFQEYQNILADGPPPAYLVCWAADYYSPYSFLVDAMSQFYGPEFQPDVLAQADEANATEDIGQQIELYHGADVTLVEDLALVIPLYHTTDVE